MPSLKLFIYLPRYILKLNFLKLFVIFITADFSHRRRNGNISLIENLLVSAAVFLVLGTAIFVHRVRTKRKRDRKRKFFFYLVVIINTKQCSRILLI